MPHPPATTNNKNVEKKKRKNKNDNDKGGSKVVTDRSSGSKSSGRGKTGGGRTKARRTPSTGTRPQALSSGTSAKPRRSSSSQRQIPRTTGTNQRKDQNKNQRSSTTKELERENSKPAADGVEDAERSRCTKNKLLKFLAAGLVIIAIIVALIIIFVVKKDPLEELLLKYFDTPLHSQVLTWLTDVNTWQPSEESKTTIVTGPNGEDQSLWEALWVERYVLA